MRRTLVPCTALITSLLGFAACDSGHGVRAELPSTPVPTADGGTTGPGVGQSPGADASVYLDGCTDAANTLGADALQRLREGGESEGLRFVYPYDGTVFPRGLAAPMVMWEADGMAEAARVQLYNRQFAYDGCLVPDAEGRLTLPQDVWDRAGDATGGKVDPFQLELTVMHEGRVRGPLRTQLVVAPGSMKGSVYYNSYSSMLAKAAGASGGAVLRIPPGGDAELFVGQRGCAGCHSASADGSRLVTNEGVYALEPGTQPNPDSLRSQGAEFAGVSPDGDVFAVSGMLYETDSGSALAQSGLPTTANQVAFSSQGRWVAFVDGEVDDRGGAGAIPVNIPFLQDLLGGSPATSDGEGLIARMRYDAASRSFTEYQRFTQVSALGRWPAPTADDQAIVFTDTASNDLMLLDIDSGEVTLLARAMGYASEQDAAAGRSYLPYADEGEARQAFFPVLAPLAVGGYFWVIFDSPRRYGNVDTAKIASGLAVPGDIASALPIEIPGGALGALASKQLWVAAIEVAADGDYRADRSAPAFFLPGQELGANNHRAFAALDPCRDAGEDCGSGTECCSGFCGEAGCESPPSRCSELEEACDASADCCDDKHACIAGYCSLVNLI